VEVGKSQRNITINQIKQIHTMNTEENNTQFTQSSVSDSASRFIENFFEDGNFLYRFRGFYV
jgi:hypothetical protein